MLKSILIEFRDNYAGPWPKAVTNLLVVVFGLPFLVAVSTDVPVPDKFYLGSVFAASVLFGLGVLAKRLYPREDDHKK